MSLEAEDWIGEILRSSQSCGMAPMDPAPEPALQNRSEAPEAPMIISKSCTHISPLGHLATQTATYRDEDSTVSLISPATLSCKTTVPKLG